MIALPSDDLDDHMDEVTVEPLMQGKIGLARNQILDLIEIHNDHGSIVDNGALLRYLHKEITRTQHEYMACQIEGF